MGVMRLRSPSTPAFVEHFPLANIKETSNVDIIGPLWRESTGDRHVDSPTKGPKASYMTPFQAIYMYLVMDT